jgi:hypothetical protein
LGFYETSSNLKKNCKDPIQIQNGITELDPESHLIMDPPDTKHRMKENPFVGKNVPTQQYVS